MMKQVTPLEYREAVDSVPEHPKRVRETRKPGSIYYGTQHVFNENGNLVAMHDDTGHWVDDSLL